MITPKELGTIFKETRERLQLSLEQVYQKSKIHLKIVQDIENGSFERLAPLYIRSFLKKYSDFLGLDTKSMLEKFDSLTHEAPPQPFSFVAGAKQPAKEKKEFSLTRQQAQAVTMTVLTVVFLVLVFVLAGMIRSKGPFAQSESGFEARKTRAERQEPVKEEPSSKSVTLTLKAKGKVWVQVKSGEKNLFAEVMSKGETETWTADGELTVWTGKAENLEFTVNGRKLGAIAAGVVKNIKVSGEGAKIGDKPVAPRE